MSTRDFFADIVVTSRRNMILWVFAGFVLGALVGAACR